MTFCNALRSRKSAKEQKKEQKMREIPPIRLGTVLFSIVEPTLGHEVEFNRWYERDHFYAGCMVGANYFSGRRWVATRHLKDLRYPLDSPVTPSIDKGSFLVTYWTLAGERENVVNWSIDQVHALIKSDRMQPPIENISTAFYQYQWGVFREGEDGVPAELALEHPYRGLAVTMIDRDENISEHDFEQFCQHHFLPSQLQKSPIAMTLCLRPQPLPRAVPDSVSPDYVSCVDEQVLAKRYLLLSFLEEDPQLCWPDKFANVGIDMQGSGYGKVVYAAPFIPTVPGTDKYLDQL
jgi:hypothetical protein